MRVEHKRHEIRYWADNGREDLGPAFVVIKKPSRKTVGRPRASVEDQRDLMRLWIATAVHEAQGKKLEAAINAAMSDLDWPDRTAAELERIRTRFRRAKNDIRQLLRLGERVAVGDDAVGEAELTGINSITLSWFARRAGLDGHCPPKNKKESDSK